MFAGKTERCATPSSTAKGPSNDAKATAVNGAVTGSDARISFYEIHLTLPRADTTKSADVVDRFDSSAAAGMNPTRRNHRPSTLNRVAVDHPDRAGLNRAGERGCQQGPDHR
jgi:hypothetical protein